MEFLNRVISRANQRYTSYSAADAAATTNLNSQTNAALSAATELAILTTNLSRVIDKLSIYANAVAPRVSNAVGAVAFDVTSASVLIKNIARDLSSIAAIVTNKSASDAARGKMIKTNNDKASFFLIVAATTEDNNEAGNVASIVTSLIAETAEAERELQRLDLIDIFS